MNRAMKNQVFTSLLFLATLSLLPACFHAASDEGDDDVGDTITESDTGETATTTESDTGETATTTESDTGETADDMSCANLPYQHFSELGVCQCDPGHGPQPDGADGEACTHVLPWVGHSQFEYCGFALVEPEMTTNDQGEVSYHYYPPTCFTNYTSFAFSTRIFGDFDKLADPTDLYTAQNAVTLGSITPSLENAYLEAAAPYNLIINFDHDFQAPSLEFTKTVVVKGLAGEVTLVFHFIVEFSP